MTVNDDCPYCGEPISFVYAPFKSFPCPRCGQPVFIRWGDLVTESDARRCDKEKEARLALFRQQAKAELRDLQDPEVIDSFPAVRISPIPDSRCCPRCLARKGKILLTRDCSPESLPPFEDCQNETDGCRCAFIAIDKWDFQKLQR